MDGPRAQHGDRSGRLHGPGSGLSADPRDEDAGVARAQAVRERLVRGKIPGETSAGRARALSGARFPSRPRAGLEADARVGSMLAFDMNGGLAAARRFCDHTEVFLLAESLGGVESLVVLPI